MLTKIFVAVLLVGGAFSAKAAPVYSCGGGSACNGNLYAVYVISQTATSYVLGVGIQVTNSYTGNTTDTIDGLAIIPDVQGSFTSATLLANPSGVWNLQPGGLNANGCNGSGAPYTCAAATGAGATLFTGTTPKTLLWVFMINGTPPSLGDTAHIKYHYIDTNGNNVGSLGSFDVCIGGGVCQSSTVPEPVTSALVGSGLMGLYFLRRRLPGSRQTAWRDSTAGGPIPRALGQKTEA
ncbi:MAG: PEP-CTERM sorting domain-containing protein [Acidobacteriota bacterium]